MKFTPSFFLVFLGTLVAVPLLAFAQTTSPETIQSLSAVAGNAFTASYYDNQDLTGLKFVRTDTLINFNWGTGSPDSSIAPDTFSVRWEGNWTFGTSATYRFTARTDDGIRAWIDGDPIFDKWFNQGPTTYTTDLPVSAGEHRIKIEYYENIGASLVEFKWEAVQPIAPPAISAPVVSPYCSDKISSAAISWQEVGRGSQGYIVDIDNDGNWGNGFWNKNIPSGTLTTQDPSGFNPSGGVISSLVLKGGTFYDVRVFYIATGEHSPTVRFSASNCEPISPPEPPSPPSEWVFEAENLYHRIGRAEADGWSANTVADNAGHLSYGPYTSAIPQGLHTASFYLMIDNNTADNFNVARLDIFDATAGKILAEKEITRKSFSKTLTYERFDVGFTQTLNHVLEFRVFWYDVAYLRQDKVVVREGGPTAPLYSDLKLYNYSSSSNSRCLQLFGQAASSLALPDPEGPRVGDAIFCGKWYLVWLDQTGFYGEMNGLWQLNGALGDALDFVGAKVSEGGDGQPKNMLVVSENHNGKWAAGYSGAEHIEILSHKAEPGDSTNCEPFESGLTCNGYAFNEAGSFTDPDIPWWTSCNKGSIGFLDNFIPIEIRDLGNGVKLIFEGRLTKEADFDGNFDCDNAHADWLFPDNVRRPLYLRVGYELFGDSPKIIRTFKGRNPVGNPAPGGNAYVIHGTVLTSFPYSRNDKSFGNYVRPYSVSINDVCHNVTLFQDQWNWHGYPFGSCNRDEPVGWSTPWGVSVESKEVPGKTVTFWHEEGPDNQPCECAAHNGYEVGGGSVQELAALSGGAATREYRFALELATPQSGAASIPRNAFLGTYFDNKDLTAQTFTRQDPAVNFDWGLESPHSSMGVDTFSARWEGMWDFATSGVYRFTARTDDGIRLWLDNSLILDKWYDQAATTYTVDKEVTVGIHRVKVEFYENGGAAVAQVNWTMIKPIQWVFEAERDLSHRIGRAEADGWSANTTQDPEGHLAFGPYTTAIPAGAAIASYYLMIDNNTADNLSVVKLDVFDATAGKVLAEKEITRKEFSNTFSYQRFDLAFNTLAGHNLEFRTWWYDRAYIREDKVIIEQGLPVSLWLKRGFASVVSTLNSGISALLLLFK